MTQKNPRYAYDDNDQIVDVIPTAECAPEHDFQPSHRSFSRDEADEPETVSSDNQLKPDFPGFPDQTDRPGALSIKILKNFGIFSNRDFGRDADKVLVECDWHTDAHLFMAAKTLWCENPDLDQALTYLNQRNIARKESLGLVGIEVRKAIAMIDAIQAEVKKPQIEHDHPRLQPSTLGTGGFFLWNNVVPQQTERTPQCL